MILSKKEERQWLKSLEEASRRPEPPTKTVRERFVENVEVVAKALDKRLADTRTFGGVYGPEGYTYRMLMDLVDTLYQASGNGASVKLEKLLPHAYTTGPYGDACHLYELHVVRDSMNARGKEVSHWFRVFLTSEDCEILPGLDGNWRSQKLVPAFAKTAKAVLRYILEWKSGETPYNSKKRMRMVKDCVALPYIDEVQAEMDAKK